MNNILEGIAFLSIGAKENEKENTEKLLEKSYKNSCKKKYQLIT